VLAVLGELKRDGLVTSTVYGKAEAWSLKPR
jgi:hypothetical protein